MTNNQNYFAAIWYTTQSLWEGLQLTFRHLIGARLSRKPLGIQDAHYFDQREGIANLQYPHQVLPVPDTGRYRLFNEIDDCIVCDKCAKICPVNCITIEPIRSAEEFGKTSDGTPKRIYAAKFDIDMGKCCFCGLCTTVCPTECLTMTKVFDFSVFDIREHNYEFAEMTDEEITDKKTQFEQYQKTKNKTTEQE
jgi:NADH-quinone oxidoreductase subunit I